MSALFSPKGLPISQQGRKSDPLYEVVHGVEVELPEMGRFSNKISRRIYNALFLYLLDQDIGEVALEELFVFHKDPLEKRRPDVAFISYERCPKGDPIPYSGDWEVVPDLAVEVLSPHDNAEEALDKVKSYFRFGVRRVWLVLPKAREVYDYSSPKNPIVLSKGEILAGGELLPGFSHALSEIFPTGE